MRKISEYLDGDALDLLADLMQPAMEIFGDEDVRDAFEKNMFDGAKQAIKRHKSAVLQILARIDNVDVEDYHCNVFTLPGRVLDILNDQDLIGFFTEQAQTMTSETSSGSATENIVEIGKKAE